ncbi:MAG: glucose 1-dehydrogenase [Drouetiella hepatica Uher 2000/2452]|jgi:glucose 1-dehydrogenase|uniref:Glucose 1-dehydrogenase n=1 Tax=Drouetiella hepatica Uher 2000/2452 TaxID=904376 RepID=A0A951QFU5_9CYAN|nr:glucose 1-dehydrogenase [Drouetiella hepatica Uher 2000/2452]
MKLEGKIALVTGSSQGIGQAIAIRLAEEGANIVIDYRSHPEGAEETKAGVEATGRRGYVIQADLGAVEDVRRMVAEGIQQFGKLDILVNNAGLEKQGDFWDVTEEDYDNVMNVNLKGVFFATQAIVQHLRETGRSGKIINISSVHEELSFPHFTTYCASKGGVKMMMRNLAVELGSLGITINNVAPGAIETPINQELLNNPDQLNTVIKNIPLGRLGQPKDVASLVAFLASADADYITGSTFFVDGGLLWNYQEQ